MRSFQIPITWHLAFMQGNHTGAYAFRVVDLNNLPVQDFTVEMSLQKPAGEVQGTFDQTSGLSKAGEKVTFDFDVELPSGRYVYQIKLLMTVTGMEWQFTVFQGEATIYRFSDGGKGYTDGLYSPLVCVLPVVWNVGSNQYVLLNTDGTPLLNTDGEPLKNTP